MIGVQKVIFKLIWTALVQRWIQNLLQEVDMRLYCTPPHKHKIKIQDKWIFLRGSGGRHKCCSFKLYLSRKSEVFFNVNNKISPIEMALISYIKDGERELSIFFSTFWQHMNGKRNLNKKCELKPLQPLLQKCDHASKSFSVGHPNGFWADK